MDNKKIIEDNTNFNLPKKYDRRVVLTEKAVDEIVRLKGQFSSRSVAKRFHVSKTTILLLWNPEKYEKRKAYARAYSKAHKLSKAKQNKYRHSLREYRAKLLLDKEEKINKVIDLLYACNYKKITYDELFSRLHKLFEKELLEIYSKRADGEVVSLWDIVN